jgi:hypothetical protein
MNRYWKTVNGKTEVPMSYGHHCQQMPQAALYYIKLHTVMHDYGFALCRDESFPARHFVSPILWTKYFI